MPSVPAPSWKREVLWFVAMFALGWTGFFSFRSFNHHRASLRTSYPSDIFPRTTRERSEDELFDKVRVFCWVMTRPGNHKTKAVAVKETWGPRCNKLLFMSSANETSLPAIALPVAEGRANLWTKSRLAWHYAYKHYGKDYDWFLKADDDTFVVLENFRYLASQFDPEDHHYMGWLIGTNGGYASGGAGYAVSRRTLNQIGPVFATEHGCKDKTGGGVEDMQFGFCLRKIGVHVDSTRDKFKNRFHPLRPEQILTPNLKHAQDAWYWRVRPKNTTSGLGCCSDLTISFHYINPTLMRELFFYVYNLHVFDGRRYVFKRH